MFYEILLEYIRFSEKEFAQRVSDDKRRAANRLFTIYAEQDINYKALQPAEWQKMLATACATLEPSTYNNVLKNLSAMWDWSVSMQLISGPNPFATIPRKKTTSTPHYAPPIQDVFKVFTIATEEEQLIMLFSMVTSASKAEMSRFRYTDISQKNNNVAIRNHNKGQHNEIAHQIDVPAFLITLLKEHGISNKCYNELFNGHSLVSADRNKSLNKLCKAAGVKSFSIEGLRTLKARIDVSNGAKLSSIQKHLRHRNLKTTKKFVKNVRSESAHLKHQNFDALVESCLLAHQLTFGKDINLYLSAYSKNEGNYSPLAVLCSSLFDIIEQQISKQQYAAIQRQLLQFIITKFATSYPPPKKVK